MKRWLAQFLRLMVPVLLIAPLLAGCGIVPELNPVSKFLYLADILANIQGLTGAISFVGLFATAICFVGWMIHSRDHEACLRTMFRRALCVITPVWAVSILTVTLIPSKNTMYAIAASQVGEQVVRSEAVQGLASDATKALQQWIRQQIEPPKK